MNTWVFFEKDTLRIASVFSGDDSHVEANAMSLGYIALGDPPPGCMYLKHDADGWGFDVGRKPDPPMAGCVWEHPRWVTPQEQIDRHNGPLIEQIDAIERGSLRAVRALLLPGGQTATAEAIAKLQSVETQIAALRAKLKT